MGKRLKDQITPLVPDEIYAPFDDENPYALINLVPPRVKESIEALDYKWFKYSESELRYKCQPSAEVARVRLSFWDEYLRAIDQHRSMSIESILKGFCAKRIFYEDWLQDEKVMAYILCPPANYAFALREMLELGWDKLREVLALPIKEMIPVKWKGQLLRDDKGEVVYEERINHKAIADITKIVAMLDLRVKGAILQKVQVDQRNVNLNVDAGSASNFSIPQSMDQLEAMAEKINSMKQNIMDMELLTSAEEDTSHIIDAHEIVHTEDGPIIAENPVTEAEGASSSAREEDRGEET